MMKVVVFGPKLKKNWARMYNARRVERFITLYPNPMTQKMRTRMANPPIWMGLRPM